MAQGTQLLVISKSRLVFPPGRDFVPCLSRHQAFSFLIHILNLAKNCRTFFKGRNQPQGDTPAPSNQRADSLIALRHLKQGVGVYRRDQAGKASVSTYRESGRSGVL